VSVVSESYAYMWEMREKKYKEQLDEEKMMYEQRSEYDRKTFSYGGMSYNDVVTAVKQGTVTKPVAISESQFLTHYTANSNTLSISTETTMMEVVESDEDRNERERLELRETLRKAQEG